MPSRNTACRVNHTVNGNVSLLILPGAASPARLPEFMDALNLTVLSLEIPGSFGVLQTLDSTWMLCNPFRMCAESGGFCYDQARDSGGIVAFSAR